jgi:hypothetical protein
MDAPLDQHLLISLPEEAIHETMRWLAPEDIVRLGSTCTFLWGLVGTLHGSLLLPLRVLCESFPSYKVLYCAHMGSSPKKKPASCKEIRKLFFEDADNEKGHEELDTAMLAFVRDAVAHVESHVEGNCGKAAGLVRRGKALAKLAEEVQDLKWYA